MPYLVYLAGPISGWSYDQCTSWREDVANKLEELSEGEILVLSPLRHKQFIREAFGNEALPVMDPTYAQQPFTTPRGIAKRDRFDCMRADAVIFNFLGCTTHEQITRGTLVEVGWSDGAPNRGTKVLIGVMEKEGNIHDHPLITESMDYIVDSVEEAATILYKVLMPHINH